MPINYGSSRIRNTSAISVTILQQYLTAWLRLVSEPQLLSKEPQPLLLIAPAVAAQKHIQALWSRQQGLQGPAQFVQIPQSDPALVLQIIASLVVAVVGREVGAVLGRRIADQHPIKLFTEFGDLDLKAKRAIFTLFVKISTKMTKFN
jgi:hypothetical protein